MVFSGSKSIDITVESVENIVGTKPVAQGSFSSGPGTVFQWADGLEILTRTQGPNVHRVEVKKNAPSGPDFGAVVDHLIKLLPLASDQTPVSVGLNYGAIVLDQDGRANSKLNSLFRMPNVAEFVGFKSASVGEAKFTTKMLGGKMVITASAATLASVDGMPGLLLTTNLTTKAEASDIVIESLAVSRLAKFERYLNRLFGRIRRIN